ncbi:hypothetical protein BH24ACT26_BH24ACT26_06550 [soil metagenome]
MPVWRVDRAFDYVVPARFAARVTIGSLVRVPFGHRRVRGIVVGFPPTSPQPELEDIASVVLEEALCPPPLDRMIEWIALRYGAPRGVSYARVVPPRVRVEVSEPRPLSGGPAPRLVTAYSGGAELLGAIESGDSGAWCLRAAAGEDHAELIAELVGAAGRAGSGAALVAVPEMRYGSAVLEGLARHWPDFARVDSARSDPARAESWLRLARGHGIGGGGRAVVLAPAPRVRLIVLDEEHHPSYKEDQAPRYHARRVALERARLQGAACVLVSASPSLETARAAAEGSIGGVEPSRAVERAARPVVELVERPRDRALAHELHRRVSTTLGAGERVALLAARRGYARAVWCASCRRSLRCPRCEGGLAYDRPPGPAAAPREGGLYDRPTGPAAAPLVRCVRCGYASAPPDACPTCGAIEWRYLGAGNERLVEQVRKTWPRAVVARADPDEPRPGGPGGGYPDIYVTTWIGTKQVLRPPVSLVGVLDADALIRRPDFRANESAYQALAEMAEWAGPAATGGRLVIQCSEPSHHALQAVVRADYRFWLERELEQRAELGYPPFAELVKLTATGPARDRLIDEAATACRAAEGRVLGPVGTQEKLGGETVRGLQALVKCPDAALVAGGLRGILATVPRGSRLRVDVDPR